MPLRVPPGRAGRIWLIGRLETARRGAGLLDRKRQALLQERRRVRAEAGDARLAWQQAADRVVMWSTRAAVIDGAARLELLAAHIAEPASLTLAWSNLMGARIPAVQELSVPHEPQLSALGASSATVALARACSDAARAAARYGAAARAEAEITEQLRQTARRLRALEKRWIPQHEQALAALDLALDESQREQAARVRWLTDQGRDR